MSGTTMSMLQLCSSLKQDCRWCSAAQSRLKKHTSLLLMSLLHSRIPGHLKKPHEIIDILNNNYLASRVGTEQNPAGSPPTSTKTLLCLLPLVCRKTEVSKASLSHKREGLSS